MDQNLSNRRAPPGAVADTVARQQHPPPQACPRCNSTNTKFCYYNNYSLSQPRYFCKGCRRYWTQGGTLRNVPVGGGCRKSKRPKLSNSAATATPPPPPQDTATATATAAITNPPPFYGGGGGGGGGFLSSLAAVHNSGAAQPMGFGPNLGLFHGLGLPSFENQLQPHLSTTRTEHSQELSFQQLLQRDVGVGPTSEVAGSSNWNLSNEDNNRHQTHWSDFPASTGLDDP